ncbi:MAG: site-2 protease family protein [Patescibacteria group bacterium]|nr:site-2 protease family protein [Patescibacteria group bacterium]
MNQQLLIQIYQVVILIFLVIIHEVSHGLMAYYLGDDTAKRAGRLTLNPLKHLEFFGSFLVPLLFIMMGSPFILGWAKPVPFNPYNLKDPKKDGALIAAAGPASNFAIAILFGVIVRLLMLVPGIASSAFWGTVLMLLSMIIFVSVLLAVFNLIPIPPFDGSRIVFAFLRGEAARFWMQIERYGTLLIIVLLFAGLLNFIYPVVLFLYRLIAGPAAVL